MGWERRGWKLRRDAVWEELGALGRGMGGDGMEKEGGGGKVSRLLRRYVGAARLFHKASLCLAHRVFPANLLLVSRGGVVTER